ncbi:MAG TPA: nucleotidyltransferase [Kiritimatiellae bacterium]|nr:nucleotidyltransferase [Kiritimatiellia bacterium]
MNTEVDNGEGGRTLLVLAAGLGKRFGGLKQIAGVGPSGEAIMEYSLYDARRVGFGRVVFVIRPEMEADFRKVILSRVRAVMGTAVVLQRIEDVPVRGGVGGEREKPWGTGHAVWAARKAVRGPFGVINADDFYGPRSFDVLADLLTATHAGRRAYGMVCFRLGQTLSEWGPVARGICRTTAEGHLVAIREYTAIRREGGKIVGRNPSGAVEILEPDLPVSMNMWAFEPRIFLQLGGLFREFLQRGPGPEDEFFLSESLNRLVGEGRAWVQVRESPERWCGITHPGDVEHARTCIVRLVERGTYPDSLYRPKGAPLRSSPD